MKKNIVIIILSVLVVCLSVFIIFDKTINKKEETVKTKENNIKEEKKETPEEGISVSNMYGTYRWEKKYVNEYGNELNLKVSITLNNDGSAEYQASSGYEYESTKGKFVFENNKIIYTREYYNYETSNNEPFSGGNTEEVFNVIDKETLQNTYYNNTTELKKQ